MAEPDSGPSGDGAAAASPHQQAAKPALQKPALQSAPKAAEPALMPSEPSEPGPRPGPVRESGEPAEGTEEKYDPEQEWRLRFDQTTGRRNFSPNAYARSVASSTGPFTVGDSSPAAGTVHGDVIGSILNVGRGRRTHLIQQVSRKRLERSTSWFVLEKWPGQPTVLDELATLLKRERLVVLAGPVGSGRTTLAVRGLDAMLAPGAKIATFRLGSDPVQLREMKLDDGNGYVIDVEQAAVRRPLSEVLNDIDGYAEQRGIHIVVLTNEAERTSLPNVHHRMPDRNRVLRTLLERVHSLTEAQLAALPESVDDSVQTSSMTELAQAAEAIAAALAVNLAADFYLRDVVRQHVARKFDQPSEILDEAAALLDDGRAASPATTKAERVHAFRRCCLLSASVFNGLPFQITTGAAAELNQLLCADDPDAPAISDLFGQPIDPLLDWLEADLAAAPDLATSRKLEFRNPSVPDVALEHVWTSHHLANASMIEWLNGLARQYQDGPNRPVEVRLRAAQAMGRIASYDFTRVMDTVIESWIKSRTVSGLLATSWAIDVMVSDPRIAAATWERVRYWSQRGRPFRRAALVVYANALEPEQIDDALDLAAREAQLPNDLEGAVPAVLRSAVLAGAHQRVFDLLSDWLEQIDQSRERARKLRMLQEITVISGLPATAARSLVLLAADGGDGAAGARGQLLSAMREDPEFAAAAARLWRLALIAPGVTGRATELLKTWLQEMDADEGVAQACRVLLPQFGRDRILRDRLTFHGRRWIAEWGGAFPAAESLLRNALRSRGRSHE